MARKFFGRRDNSNIIDVTGWGAGAQQVSAGEIPGARVNDSAALAATKKTTGLDVSDFADQQSKRQLLVPELIATERWLKEELVPWKLSHAQTDLIMSHVHRLADTACRYKEVKVESGRELLALVNRYLFTLKKETRPEQKDPRELRGSYGRAVELAGIPLLRAVSQTSFGQLFTEEVIQLELAVTKIAKEVEEYS